MKEDHIFHTKLVLALLLVVLVIFSALPAYGEAPAKINANTTNGAISAAVASPPYIVSFKETGLTPNMTWNVTLLGIISGAGTYHNFTNIYNGSYSFSVASFRIGNNEYIPSPSNGEVTVNGGDVTVPISFYNQTVVAPTGKIYDLNFSFTSIPSVMPGISWTWSASITGTSVPFGPDTYYSTGFTMNLSSLFVNGTYSYTISPAMGTYISPGAGSFTINGKNLTLNLSVTLQPHYTVNFYETGLPSTVTFTVSVRDSPTGGAYYSGSNTTAVSAHNYVGFSLTNETYNFVVSNSNQAVYAPRQESGSVTVSGSTISVNIAFVTAPQTYSVLFQLSNPPAVSPYSNWEWIVGINGSQYHSYNTSLEIGGLPAGSYTFIAYGNGIAISTSSGTFTVSGSSTTTVSLNVEASWSVAFEITDPSPNTGFPYYNANIAYPIPGYGSISLTASSFAGITAFAGLPDGTYSYTLSLEPGNYYTLTPTSGTFTVNGGNVTIDVTASYLSYSVQFSEQGLLSNPVVEWGVVLDNGYYFNTSTPISGTYEIEPSPIYVTLQLPAGTYMIQGFVINSLGKFIYQAPQQITVGNGANVNVIQFSSGASTASTGSLSLTDYGFIGGGVGIAIVGVIAGLLFSRRRNSGGSAP